MACDEIKQHDPPLPGRETPACRRVVPRQRPSRAAQPLYQPSQGAAVRIGASKKLDAVSRGPSILLIRAKAWELLARGFRCGAHLTAPNTVLFPSTSKWQNRAEWLSSRLPFRQTVEIRSRLAAGTDSRSPGARLLQHG